MDWKEQSAPNGWKDLKYLLAYAIPLSAGLALYLRAWWSFSTLVVAFVLIPILEGIVRPRPEADLPEPEGRRAARRFFDLLLYANLPILYGLIVYFLYLVSTHPLSWYELLGLTGSMSIVVGTIGINVGHELGHRHTRWEQAMAKALLLPALYMHFFIEHNHGHHRRVATPDDPATARRGEPLYAFWWRSVFGGYLHAWSLETTRLHRQGRRFWSRHNAMLRFSFYQAAYVLLVWGLAGPLAAGAAIAIALGGVLLLETVNYIEHYGLLRRRLPSGRYEPVSIAHAWNSEHELGRIVLYELTRHADHHYKANRKYQILRHWDRSPELPYSYPTSMLIALLPPLWFRIMDPEVAAWEEKQRIDGALSA